MFDIIGTTLDLFSDYLFDYVKVNFVTLPIVKTVKLRSLYDHNHVLMTCQATSLLCKFKM